MSKEPKERKPREKKDPTLTKTYQNKLAAADKAKRRREITDVIEYFVKTPVPWAKEVHVFAPLYEMYPVKNFWFSLNWFKGEKIPTMLFFATEKAKARLVIEYAVFNIDIPVKEEYSLENNKVGEDYQVAPTKQNIFQFCKKK